MPVVTKRASEMNLRRRSKSSLSNQRRRLKAAASTDRIVNDENDGEVAHPGGNANKKAKTCGGRRALLEIAWWTVTPNMSDYLNTSDGHASNSYILYSRSPTPSIELDQRAQNPQQQHVPHNHTPPVKRALPAARPAMSRTSSMR